MIAEYAEHSLLLLSVVSFRRSDRIERAQWNKLKNAEENDSATTYIITITVFVYVLNARLQNRRNLSQYPFDLWLFILL